ncbi:MULTISPECIES: hypothetical protein [Flavobacterium]|uniref:Uncharacterized protein n=1 Tax=Flavobacterium keumense TaxID=1306518 RepID=A0ABY8N4H4_9FLAO|nr:MULTISPECIES: hypothetical protein [Flavobacterium]WGK94545.1 hypothetical protein MG292_10750 [Flavobacterium keumense]
MKNNISKGVFTELVEEFGKKSSFDMFMELDDILKITTDGQKIIRSTGSSVEANHINSSIRNKVNNRFVDIKQEYGRIIRSQEFRQILDKLVALETEMIQSRCFLNIDVKLGITKRVIKSGEKVEYVIARAPFYRPGYVRSELTVYMGGIQELGNDLDKLRNDKKFMSNAYEELRDAMIKEMRL